LAAHNIEKWLTGATSAVETKYKICKWQVYGYFIKKRQSTNKTNLLFTLTAFVQTVKLKGKIE